MHSIARASQVPIQPQLHFSRFAFITAIRYPVDTVQSVASDLHHPKHLQIPQAQPLLLYK
jgi:hypothetical protein